MTVDRDKQRALQQQVLALRRKLTRGGRLSAADQALIMEASAFADKMPENVGRISAVALAEGVLKKEGYTS